mmetsp:Transcript_73303/g.122401  ORF Transcript_73303/g.122401 Transcript_73303/m.122401 type:complete len:208 (-) Transcript_73303:171-794(-)|eukprot:CAMPEP_0119309020 /NCGR_PEP_ID=MMETSP1333-20130426/13636_1 /TAXON_ID=418940 /ORGANISM="Scyphosphaera apsteinii, Strain RCC1455" /LENGTH=207 /DNA_ID=CAMNT_0007312921 /DNA_START=15 /DNA_END=638 /DNA_ORIENTATION=+
MMVRIVVPALIISTVVAELQVKQYEGPTECEEANKVKAGDQLGMHYTGTIDASSKTGTPGKKFDSSRDRGEVFATKIGVGQVIKGWDQGLIGLCKGAKATLVIPPDMGYGDHGAGADIPGGATLNFDVEVVTIDEAPPEQNLFVELDTDKDARLTKEEVLSFFTKQGKTELPEGLWSSEDKDKNGFIEWEEFGGPKGATKPDYKDEL